MVDYTIVGGGLAGLALVESLLDEGAEPARIRVVDADRPARASDAPTAIFHPFPGRSLEPVPRKLRLAEATVRRIERWRTRLDDPPILETTMVRPVADDHLAERLLDTWAGSDGYPEWFDGRKVDSDELADLGAHLTGYAAGFVYRPAYTVDLGELTAMLAENFASAGVRIDRPFTVESLRQTDGGWRLESGDGAFETGGVVFALGRALADWFDGLAMTSRGGELMHLRDLDGGRLGHVVNAGGHVAPHPRGGIVAGSSWWDPADFDARDDDTAASDILERCAPLYPPIDESNDRRIWRGVRAMFGDHQPLVGPVPDLPGCHVFGAFGSKGLLRIPHHADQFARRLLDRPANVPELSDTTRIGPDKWAPVPGRIAPPVSE